MCAFGVSAALFLGDFLGFFHGFSFPGWEARRWELVQFPRQTIQLLGETHQFPRGNVARQFHPLPQFLVHEIGDFIANLEILMFQLLTTNVLLPNQAQQFDFRAEGLLKCANLSDGFWTDFHDNLLEG